MRGERTGRIPAGVVALGGVSLLMDTSSEAIHSLLPVFLVSVLGAGALDVGLVEGVAEATAAVSRVFSGVWSDRSGRRKLPAVLGYGLAAATKPLFALAPGVGTVLLARFLDRVGKGIRGAPRDALVADLTPPELRGASYGLRQALDTVGAFLGPLLAIGLMAATGDAFRIVFGVAVVPAVAAVLLLVVAVREPARREPAAASAPDAARAPAPPAGRSDGPDPALAPAAAGRATRGFGALVAVACLLALARLGEAFLVLRAESLGLDATWAPVVFLVVNGAYAVASYPAGRLSDRVGRARTLAAGAGLLLLASVVLALARDMVWAAAGAAFWGLHLAATQGVIAAVVADVVPAARRGAAFGVLYLAVAAASLAAGIGAGALWEAIGPGAAFGAGAVFAAAALATCAALPGPAASTAGAAR